jgi:F0F1-type ATP synthase assembly protein I
MALISCPECKTEVSEYAEKCPKCSYPLKKSITESKAQEVELTSKRLKGRLIIAVMLMIGGMLLLLIGHTVPFLLVIGCLVALFGAILSVATKISIWWHHK